MPTLIYDLPWPDPAASSPRVNILLVDDHPENLVALDSVLEGLGQNLVRATSGQEALKHLLREDYAVILLDVQMPGMDGFETAALIRARPKTQHTPIIFLTAINKGERYVTQGYSVGAVDYVFKPFEPEVLRAKVSAFVELAKKTRQLEDEIAQRQQAEEKIKRLNRDLERRVKERTAEIEAAVGRLETEIAERKALEQALQQRAEALAEADRRKNEFLAMLGHELRNPLAPILNAIHVMRQPGADAPTLERAREIVERQTHHLTRLIDDLLDVSRITQGKIDLREAPVDLSEVIDLAVEAALPLFRESGIEFTVHSPADPIWVWADGVRLQQVFLNLLNNAAKYTEAGGRVSFSAGREDGEVAIRVRDTGIGIPADMLPRVFELFAQADCSLDRSQGGLGIGLTLVRTLIQLHGGSVVAHSEGPGRGSEFTVRLPLLPGASVPAASVPAASPVSPPESWLAASPELPLAALSQSSLGPAPDLQPSADRINVSAGEPPCDLSRVLIIEDNEDAAESLGDLLSLLGYEVEQATSGPLGIEIAERFHPQVILCDIGLPGLDGFQVAARLRGDPRFRKAVLVALTGYGQSEDRERTQRAGFDMHLTKPVDPERLEELLRALPNGCASG